MPRQSAGQSDPALTALAGWPEAEPIVLLHSGRPHPRWARRSLLARPRAWFRHWPGGRSELAGDLGTAIPALTHRPWRDLRMLLNHPALPGRWFGYFSYELAHVIEPHKLPRTGAPGDWPLIELAWCPQVDQFPVSGSHTGAKRSAAPSSSTPLAFDFTRTEYEAAVQRVIDYIAAGDVFQVNLAQRLRCTYTGGPRELFAQLAAVSPAWYGAYLELSDASPPHDGAPRSAAPGPPRALLSTSPELFLQLEDRHVITRPIKGTRPATPAKPGSEAQRSAAEDRDIPPDSDPAYHELLHSEKDTAELTMIVDLMRNDLGRVCAYGSVRVDEPRTIETHPTIHHGVATISGELHERYDIVDLLRAALPGGSITGAPKVRAMQIIDELEPAPRGPYCGSIGWISKDACQLNIAIRTMMLHAEAQRSDASGGPAPYDISFHVGGGIVADSDPAAEYDETLTKARAMLTALGIEVRMPDD